jgi:hypothetical protein
MTPSFPLPREMRLHQDIRDAVDGLLDRLRDAERATHPLGETYLNMELRDLGNEVMALVNDLAPLFPADEDDDEDGGADEALQQENAELRSAIRTAKEILDGLIRDFKPTESGIAEAARALGRAAGTAAVTALTQSISR